GQDRGVAVPPRPACLGGARGGRCRYGGGRGSCHGSGPRLLEQAVGGLLGGAQRLLRVRAAGDRELDRLQDRGLDLAGDEEGGRVHGRHRHLLRRDQACLAQRVGLVLLGEERVVERLGGGGEEDRKSTRLNSSHVSSSYAVFCWKKKTQAYNTANTLSGTR